MICFIRKMRFSFITITTLILTLSNCSSLDTSRIAPGYVDAYKSIRDYFSSDGEEIPVNIINKIPYASIKLSIGRGSEGLLILESKTESNEYWVSADEVILEINDGRIVATKGLMNNLRESINQITLKEILNEQQFKSLIYLSFDEPKLNNLKLESNMRVIGKENIRLFSGTKELTLIIEEIKSEHLGWTVQNKYWVDENGYCWKSEQNISPLLPTFYIEVAKKPA